jgi:hypothetical protein
VESGSHSVHTGQWLAAFRWTESQGRSSLMQSLVIYQSSWRFVVKVKRR